MSEQKSYTYEQIAKMLNLKTAAAVYQKIQRNYEFYEPYLVKVDNKQGMTEEGFELYKTNAHKKNKRKNYTKQTKVKNNQNTLYDKNEYNRLLDEIKYLREQLDIAQKNLGREQALHADTKQELKLLKDGSSNISNNGTHENIQNERKHFWDKWFKD